MLSNIKQYSLSSLSGFLCAVVFGMLGPSGGHDPRRFPRESIGIRTEEFLVAISLKDTRGRVSAITVSICRDRNLIGGWSELNTSQTHGVDWWWWSGFVVVMFVVVAIVASDAVEVVIIGELCIHVIF